MTTINNLTALDVVSAGDQVPLYSSSNGDARRASMSAVQTYVLQGLANSITFKTQYAAPSSTGFSVTIGDGPESTWLVLTPVAGYAAGTILLPPVATCVEGQQFVMNTTQSIATFTVSGNGATVTGAPVTMAANAHLQLRFEPVAKVWYRAG
jgi:hypothetical protein